MQLKHLFFAALLDHQYYIAQEATFEYFDYYDYSRVAVAREEIIETVIWAVLSICGKIILTKQIPLLMTGEFHGTSSMNFLWKWNWMERSMTPMERNGANRYVFASKSNQ